MPARRRHPSRCCSESPANAAFAGTLPDWPICRRATPCLLHRRGRFPLPSGSAHGDAEVVEQEALHLVDLRGGDVGPGRSVTYWASWRRRSCPGFRGWGGKRYDRRHQATTPAMPRVPAAGSVEEAGVVSGDDRLRSPLAPIMHRSRRPGQVREDGGGGIRTDVVGPVVGVCGEHGLPTVSTRTTGCRACACERCTVTGRLACRRRTAPGLPAQLDDRRCSRLDLARNSRR